MARHGLVILSVVVVAAVVLSVFLVGGLVAPSGDGRGRLVAVTWGLLGEIVYRLGGGEIEVVQLLPPGVEAHEWEPTPDVVREASRSRLLVWTVEGFDDWGVRVAESAGVRSFKASEGLTLLEAGHDNGHDHSHVGIHDVHFWLDPRNVGVLVENLVRELSREFPELTPRIRENAAVMLGELDGLHGDFSRALEPYRGRVFVTQHAAFGYLAEAYGLRVLSVLGPEEEEPSAARLVELRRVLEGICAIYGEDGFVHPLVESLGREYGLRVLMLYTGEGLTLDGVREGKGYVYFMRLNLEALVEGFMCG